MVLALHIKIVSLTGEKWQLNNLRIHQKWMKIDFYHFNIQSRFLTKLFSVGIPLMKCCPELYCLTSRSELGEKGGVRLQNQGGGGWGVFLHLCRVLRTLLSPRTARDCITALHSTAVSVLLPLLLQSLIIWLFVSVSNHNPTLLPPLLLKLMEFWFRLPMYWSGEGREKVFKCSFHFITLNVIQSS